MQIPDSSDNIVVVRPSGKTFVTGLASAFDEEYDAERLTDHIAASEYQKMIETINDTLLNYFPCPLAWCFGYLCCPFTLGLSLFCPAVCVNDAEEEIRTMIARWNRKKLAERNVTLVLRKRRGTSWLEWHLPDTPVGQTKAEGETLNTEEGKTLLDN